MLDERINALFGIGKNVSVSVVDLDTPLASTCQTARIGILGDVVRWVSALSCCQEACDYFQSVCSMDGSVNFSLRFCAIYFYRTPVGRFHSFLFFFF